MTMATDASSRDPPSRVSAVSGALAQSATSLGAVNGVFGDASGGAFANAGGENRCWSSPTRRAQTPAVRQSVIDAAAPPGGTGQVYGPDMTVQLIAVLQAVDDQRAKAFDRLGDDDRSAAQLVSSPTC